VDDDDPNDPEFTPIEPAPLDKEELRNVEISKQEYSNLIKELIDACDEKILNTVTAESESPKEIERKSHHLIATDSPYRRSNAELNTPTPIEEILFQPNLISTLIVSEPNDVLNAPSENETIQIVATDDENPIIIIPDAPETIHCQQ